jgi:hypothetical protein
MGYLFDDTMYFAREIAPWFLTAAIFCYILSKLIERAKRRVRYTVLDLRTDEVADLLRN